MLPVFCFLFYQRLFSNVARSIIILTQFSPNGDPIYKTGSKIWGLSSKKKIGGAKTKNIKIYEKFWTANISGSEQDIVNQKTTL